MKSNFTSILRIGTGFAILSIFSLLYMPLFVLFLPWRGIRVRLGNLYGKIITPIMLVCLGTPMQLHNAERLKSPRPAIYLSNHASQLDPLIAIKVCPFGGCGVAKKEIVKVPFFGWAYRLSGHLLLDRSNKESAIKSLMELGDLVKKHNIGVWIWPEGTRSVDGSLLPFKKGFAHIALQTKLPIIPVVVTEAEHRWPSKTLLINPGPFQVTVLEPISTDDWQSESIDEHIAFVENIYKEALAQKK